MIHMATFNPLTANDGLVLAMICVGAVYSDRLGMREVRWLMEFIKFAVYRSSEVYKLFVQTSPEELPPDAQSSADLEELQALILMVALFIWHGSRKQRQQGRAEFWALAEIARRINLVAPLSTSHTNFSPLHQLRPLDDSENSTWTWPTWVEQEKRVRTLYLIFLIDAANTIFFNAQPLLDVNEIQLPLPADDAAWEARSREDCANALGLRGETAHGANAIGTRPAKQMALQEALHLLYQGGDFPLWSTNLYSKFILIHAIHVQISLLQRQILGITNTPSQSGFASSGANTPDGTTSNSDSGQVTPVEGINSQYLQAHQRLRQTIGAVECWKRVWDADMQYPPSQPRLGYCRDGIHYYFLARVFLRSPRREEWACPADMRCQQVFSLLKQIRAHVASDSAQKGLDVGSVTTVDDSYGLADLTLNMKLLFTPIDQPSY
jgi:hypothetical protein